MQVDRDINGEDCAKVEEEHPSASCIAVAFRFAIFYLFIDVAYNNNVVKMQITKPIVRRKVAHLLFLISHVIV